MLALLVYLIPSFLCWGSFLNVLATRLIEGESLLERSHCPHCRRYISWYDLIPLISFFVLRCQCRFCKSPISSLYPFIELLTAILMTALWVQSDSLSYFIGYFIFFSALIVTIRSDLEYMLIARAMTLGIIPFGWLASATGMIPISVMQSIMGTVIGYGILWATATAFKKMTGKDGMGEGDFDLLALIGSFTGIMGVWASLTFGSFLGSIIGIGYIMLTGTKRDIKIPFGPFLAGGAIIFTLFHACIMNFFTMA